MAFAGMSLAQWLVPSIISAGVVVWVQVTTRRQARDAADRQHEAEETADDVERLKVIAGREDATYARLADELHRATAQITDLDRRLTQAERRADAAERRADAAEKRVREAERRSRSLEARAAHLERVVSALRAELRRAGVQIPHDLDGDDR